MGGGRGGGAQVFSQKFIFEATKLHLIHFHFIL